MFCDVLRSIFQLFHFIFTVVSQARQGLARATVQDLQLQELSVGVTFAAQGPWDQE